MAEKSTFKLIFFFMAVGLLLLPLITTFNEFLTRVVMEIKIYRLIQDLVVPLEARIISAILKIIGITAIPTPTSVHLGKITTIGNDVTISWNCIGWQSFILLIFTLVTGLQGPYTTISKAQTILIGLLGTFWFNIFRITFVIILAQRLNQLAALVFHDYLSTLMIIFWLFIFWWFSYSFVLERKRING